METPTLISIFATVTNKENGKAENNKRRSLATLESLKGKEKDHCCDSYRYALPRLSEANRQLTAIYNCLVMVDLSLLSINEKAPYRVEELNKPGIFRFTTDNGVVIAIQFEADDLLSCAETYQLIVINLNQRKSPRDKKVKETILAIVEEFFSKNQAALLYICETGDGKQSMRSRLFELWFHAYRRQKRFLTQL